VKNTYDIGLTDIRTAAGCVAGITIAWHNFQAIFFI
jgi:hypothetical protein